MVSKIKCVCVFFGQYQERQASHCYVTRYLTIVCVCLCVCVGGGGVIGWVPTFPKQYPEHSSNTCDQWSAR